MKSYTNVVHKNTNTSAGRILNRSATEPNIRPAVIAANWSWYKANAIEGMAGAVSGKAFKPTFVNPANWKLPIKDEEDVSEKVSEKPNKSHWTVTTEDASKQMKMSESAFLVRVRPA